MTDGLQEKRGWPAAIILSSVALWGMHFLPFLLPKARLWGFNHLLFLSPINSYIYLIGGLLVLALYLPPMREWFWKIYCLVADRLFSRRFRFKLLLLSIVAMVVFWLARVPTSLLGDGYTLIYNLGNDMPVVFKWSEIGSVKVIYFLSNILPFSGLKLGEYSYAIASVMAGAVTFSFLGMLAYELAEQHAGRLFILCLLLLSGWMILFFGYVENYPVIWPFVAAYLYFSIRFIKGRGNLIAPTVLVLIALTLHLQILFFLISYPVLMFSRGPGERFYQSHKKMVWIFLAVLCLAGVILFLRRYNVSLAFRTFFVPLFARPGVPYYSLLSPSHLLDMINEYILLIPMLPVLAVITWKYWYRIITDKIDCFLAAFSLGGILFMFVIDPKLGMACDWDLFALSGVGPVLLLSRQFNLDSDTLKKFSPAVIALALILAFPFFASIQGYQSSIKHFKWLLNLDVPRSRFGMTFFRQYYVDIGDQVQADSLHREIVKRFPILNLGNMVTRLTEAGRYKEALTLADSIYQIDPYSVEPYNLRGWVYLQMGEYAKSIENLEQSLLLGRYDLRILNNLGQANMRIARYDEAVGLFRRAQSFAPEYFPILDGLANGFFMLQQYDSAIVYADKAIKQNPEYLLGYEVAGVASYQMGAYPEAEKYLSRYVQLAPESSRKSKAVSLLAALKKRR